MDTYSPYNPRNKPFTEKHIHTILHTHGLPHYRVSNPRLFQTAMVHTTYVRRGEYKAPDGSLIRIAPCPRGVLPLQDESYECMEFEGDAVLGVCIATYLRKTFPEKKQGFLTDARKELVNNERLGSLSQKIGLDDFYVISRHNEDAPAIQGRTNTKKLGDILEAFIGALWMDCGNRFHIVYSFVVSVMETYLDIQDIVTTATNYKDIFQKYYQHTKGCTPTYKMTMNDPVTHEIRVVVCDDSGTILGKGSGTTRKKAEQSACLAALTTLGVAAESFFYPPKV